MKDQLDIAHVEAQIAKLMAETEKLQRESRWLPLFYGAAIFGTAVAFVKLFLH